ncbi:MAG: hypothetical protein LUE13_04615 [Akkermansiaceae bacterium]|nr:hypothetical protein [Akkermansiaceae bacterium]
MPNDSPSPLPEDWMIYPGVRQAVRICALTFCAGIVLTVLHHLLMPVFFHRPGSAAWIVPTALLAEIAAIISLSLLVAWGARALLASRGSYVTRTLSFLMVFPSLYAALLLLSASPAVVRLMAADTVLETTLLLAAVTAFFSLPYIKGYPAPWRRSFLTWAVLAACYALQGALIVLLMSLWMNLADKPPQFLPGMLMALSCTLELALCFFSVLLAWTLYRRVPLIVSMPEKNDPRFPDGKT